MSDNLTRDAVSMETRAAMAIREAENPLRFITCGSAGDGKSSLLGRLAGGPRQAFEDRSGTADVDIARFGIQGIAGNVAHHCFESGKRTFMVADPSGGEHDVRNMAASAAAADLAVVLVDARKGIVTQTRRHCFIASLLGIRHLLLAVNKMDLIGYDQAKFDTIARSFSSFAAELDVQVNCCVPVSALTGANVRSASDEMPWYTGPSLKDALETIEIPGAGSDRDLRFPVDSANHQGANHPGASHRGLGGTVASGRVARGMSVVASLSGKTSTVSKIVGPSGELEQAHAGQCVTLVLEDEVDIGPGDIIAQKDRAPEVADQFAAHVIWMDQDEMLPERSYVIRLAAATATVRVTDLVHRVDVNTLDHLAAKTLERNEVGYCKIALDRAVAFDPYGDNRHIGAFVLIDKFTEETVGAGVIDFALRRASNIAWQDMKVDKATRASVNGQKPCVLWFTGLSGAGKSTIADGLEQALHAAGRRTYVLDGDNVRHGLNKDLGFTDQDRVENIRRVAEVSKLLVDAGLIVLVSFISPFRAERQMARALMEDDEFVEIFIDTPLEVCETRDTKGLYKKARAGELKNFTGIDSDYEIPLNAEITLRTTEAEPSVLIERVIEFLNSMER